MLSALCCHSFEIRGNGSTKRLELVPAYRKCLHYYAYWIDPQCGWMHTRLQTWFPFSMWTCLNGREWLCRQLEQAGVGYTRRDNCLTQVADLDLRGELIQQQLQTDWPQLLASFADRIFPRRFSLLARERQDYYWTLDESEWATDVMFHSSRQLAAIYPQLVQHALSVFTSRDILRFLGRAIPPDGDGGRFAGEASGDLRFRPEGMRVKHRINRNSLKMYDKQGSVLRIETTINDPADFRVYRTKEGDEAGKPEWRPMRKGVSDIHRRAKVSQQANERYLEGLAAAKATEPLSQLVDPLIGNDLPWSASPRAQSVQRRRRTLVAGGEPGRVPAPRIPQSRPPGRALSPTDRGPTGSTSALRRSHPPAPPPPRPWLDPQVTETTSLSTNPRRTTRHHSLTRGEKSRYANPDRRRVKNFCAPCEELED
ncbi:MAG: hypothetical protein U0935_18040 [Pirellulales bacterium]